MAWPFKKKILLAVVPLTLFSAGVTTTLTVHADKKVQQKPATQDFDLDAFSTDLDKMDMTVGPVKFSSSSVSIHVAKLAKGTTEASPIPESPLANGTLPAAAMPKMTDGKFDIRATLWNKEADDAETFFNTIAPDAQRVAISYGVRPSVLMAQAALESDFGRSSLASVYHNYFGIKAVDGQDSVDLPTNEEVDGKTVRVTAAFACYDSAVDSMIANASLLRNHDMYSGTWLENTSSYYDETKALTGTYATSSSYARSLNAVITTYRLAALDIK